MGVKVSESQINNFKKYFTDFLEKIYSLSQWDFHIGQPKTK